MSAVKDEKEKEVTEKQAPQLDQKFSSHHSLNELLQVALDMGDQRVIDAVKKKIEEE